MRISSFVIILIAVAIFAELPNSGARAQSTGSSIINGHVVDAEGDPLAGASVHYKRLYNVAMIAPGTIKGTSGVPLSGTFDHGLVTSDATGLFSIGNLSEGTYSLCASVPGSAYLSPCVWGQSIRIAVGSNATASQLVPLTKGVLLNVRINDPGGLLGPATDTPIIRAKLLVGVVYGEGAYQAAVGKVDAGGRTYALSIPAGVSFNLRLFSHDVALIDQAGTAVDTSGLRPIPFQAVNGQKEVFTFTANPLK